MKTLVVSIAFAIVLVACSGSDPGGVASLEDSQDQIVEEQSATSDEHAAEEAVLGFAQCMRDNGIEEFEDPDVAADGSLDFRRGQGQISTVDPETMRAAFEAFPELRFIAHTVREQEGVRDQTLSGALRTRAGLLAPALRYPVVPAGWDEVRFQISASHTDGDLNQALAALEGFPEGGRP